MVQTTIGPMEWGFESCSLKYDNKFDLWFNEIIPPIEDCDNGTKRLKFGMQLNTGIPREVWEVGYYNPQGFERAIVSRHRDGANLKRYRPVQEQDLKAPESVRFAIMQIAMELNCRTWYRLHQLHLSIVIEDYRSTSFDKDEFIVWLGKRLDQIRKEYWV